MHIPSNNSVKIAYINSDWNNALCENCNQNILSGPGEVSTKSETGKLRVFHAPIEGYINWEHTGFVKYYAVTLS